MNENPLNNLNMNNSFNTNNSSNNNSDMNNNSNEFNSKKINMNRSNTIITFMLCAIIFLMVVIGYLIYANVKSNNDKKLKYVEKCSEPEVVECEKKETSYAVDTSTLDTLETLLPKISGTTYIDYNLFNTEGLDKAQIDKLNTTYDVDNYYKVVYYIYKIEVSEKRVYLYYAVALYNDRTGKYYMSADQINRTISGKDFNPDSNKSLQRYGTKFKLTFYNSTVGYYLEKIEAVEV